MSHPPITDPKHVREMIESCRSWYHRIELVPGIVTPGIHDSPAALRRLDGLGLPPRCAGMRVLDIGCRDGFFAFEMEKRGAEVVGIDYAPPDETGFSVAARVLASRVTYVVENVYNLDPAKLGTFDIVLFLGVIYHLRNPLLALDRVRSVSRVGSLLFVESELSPDPSVSRLNVPLWQFLPRDSLVGDPTNKWAPNMPGLRLAIEECQYEILHETAHANRGYVAARAVSDDQLEFYRQLDSYVGQKDPAPHTTERTKPVEEHG